MTVARPLAVECHRQRGLFVVASLAACGLGLAAVLLPALSGWFITGAALAGAAGPAAAIGFNTLLPSAGIRLLAILRTGCRYGERLAGHDAALRVMARLRPWTFAALAASGPTQAQAVASGDALARVTGDVQEIEAALVRRPAAWTVAAAILAALAALPSPGPAALALSAVAIVCGAAWLIARRGATRGAEVVRLTGSLKEEAMQLLAARAELRAYALEEWAAAHIAERSAALAAAQRRAVALPAVFEPVAATAAGMAAMGVLALCAARSLPVAALSMLGTLALVELAAAWGRGLQRHGHLVAAQSRLGDLVGGAGVREAVPTLPADAVIELPALGVRLERGRVLGLAGPSGSGKTTLLEALAGLRAVPPGVIRADGADLASLPPGATRPLVSLLAQDAPVLAATVRENLRLARADATDSALWQALHCAVLDARVAALPGGLDAWVGEGGARLSGGERRRLCLARALLRPAPLLLLDEPTEGLEAATEALVVARLRAWLSANGQGAVVVSHRPAPLTLCERVVHLPPASRRTQPDKVPAGVA